MSENGINDVARIRGTTRVVGVWGWPVKHSASPAMHNAAFGALGMDWAYIPFAVSPDLVGDAVRGVRALGLAGVNVTVPLKELVAPFLDAVDSSARIIGSVNTIINSDGFLYGLSTDGVGFLAALGEVGITDVRGLRVVMMGAGGSARAVLHALLAGGAGRVVVANRNVERAFGLAAEFAGYGEIVVAPLTEESIGYTLADADLLINTTSVGMHPNEGEMPPVPEHALRPELVVCDLIYNPWRTKLIGLAESRGCRTQNGVEMLVRQGALSFSLWTGGIEPPLEVMRAAVRASVR